MIKSMLISSVAFALWAGGPAWASGADSVAIGEAADMSQKRPIAAMASPALADEPETSVIDTVIVTAPLITYGLQAPTTAGSRLGLSALDIPASVQTLSGDAIRLRGDASINVAITRATGYTTQATVGNGGNSVSVRGFNAASVAFLYDGVRNLAGLGNLGFPYDPWTVDRVEVLNGPASVLFGAGGIGGAINVIPRRPSATADHTVAISAGSFKTYKAALDSTGPITDRLLYRFDVSHQRSSGYIDRGESRSTAISGALTYVASDELKFTLSHDYATIRPMNYNGLPLVNGVALKALRKINYATDDVDVHFNENTTRLSIDWQPRDDIQIRNITSMVLADRLWRQGPTQLVYRPATNDILRRSYGQYEQNQHQFNTQIEARFSQTLGGLKNLLSIGGDYEDLYFKRLVGNFTGAAATSVVSLTNPTPGQYLAPFRTTLNPAQAMDVTRYSLFAEDNLSVTDRLSLVGGIRWDHMDVVRRDLAGLSPAVAERTFKPLNWRVGAVFQAAPKLNIYGQYSKATDPLSNLCCISAAQLGFDPSFGRQIEVGVKQSTWNDRLEWSLAAYRITKNNLLIPDPNNVNVSIQVGEQSSRGIEATVTLIPLPGLRIEANGTVLDARYDAFFEVVSGVRTSRAGNRPTNVPEQSANLWVSYAVNAQWRAQAGVRYVGDRYINNANTLSMPSYTVMDASVRWRPADRLAIDFRVLNLFDRFYGTTFLGDGNGGGQPLLAPPRSFEVALTTSF